MPRTRPAAVRRYRRRLAGLAAAAATLALAACGSGSEVTQGSSEAETTTLTVASFFTKGSPFSEGYTSYFRALEEASDGRLKFEIFEAGSLLEQRSMLSGVSSGRADIGLMADSFHPGELPLNQVSSLPFISENSEAQVQAFQTLYDENEAFQAEYEAQNLQLLYFVPPGPNAMQSKQPVDSLDDLAGMKVRATGVMANAVTAVGATTVAINLPEVYEALERGVVDAGLTGLENIADLGWFEVADYTINPGTGLFITNPLVMNKDAWDGLPADLQELFVQQRDDAIAVGLDAQVAASEQACQDIEDLGGSVVQLPEADVERWRALVEDDLRADFVKSAGGAVAEEFLQQYLDAIKEAEAGSDYLAGPSLCQ